MGTEDVVGNWNPAGVVAANLHTGTHAYQSSIMGSPIQADLCTQSTSIAWLSFMTIVPPKNQSDACLVLMLPVKLLVGVAEGVG